MKIGSDICSIARIKKLFTKQKEKFLRRIVTVQEFEEHKILNPRLDTKLLVQFLASRYSAKEAVVKMLGTGIGAEIGFQDIEILRVAAEPHTKPIIVFSEKAQVYVKGLGLNKYDLSISHENNYVFAVCVGV